MMDFVIGMIFAWGAVLLVSIMLQAPKRSLMLTSTIGAIGWGTYLLASSSLNEVLSTFIASLMVMILAHLCARKYKYPTTIFIVACHFLFVPGEAIYRAVFSLLQDDPALFQHYLLKALMISGSIALSIMLIDTLFSLRKRTIK